MGKAKYFEMKDSSGIQYVYVDHVGGGTVSLQSGIVGKGKPKKRLRKGKMNFLAGKKIFEDEVKGLLDLGFKEAHATEEQMKIFEGLPPTKKASKKEPKKMKGLAKSVSNELPFKIDGLSTLGKKIVTIYEKSMADANFEMTIAFSGPFKKSEVDTLAKKMKIKFPQAYVEILISLGAFKIVSKDDAAKPYAKIKQSRYELLSPDEVLRTTNIERKAYVNYADKETYENLLESVLFQRSLFSTEGSYYAFRTKDASIQRFEHDNHYRFAKKSEKFDAHILNLLGKIC